MKYLVSVDPGENSGVAVFKHDKLHKAFNVKRRRLESVSIADICDLSNEPFELLIECPRIYPMVRQKGDPNDLITLAILVGIISSQNPLSSFVYPYEWKGNTPKDISHKRIQSILTPEEKSKIKKSDKDVLDAIGIGLWKLGRKYERKQG